MATIGGSNIVTSGLILSLDAANSRSYPGSGTTWTDLSGNSNNGSITNGPVFSSANQGSIVFDGTNDYVGITPVSGLNIGVNFTIQTWCKPSKFGGAISGNFNRGSIFTNSYPYSSGQGVYISFTSQAANFTPTPGAECVFISMGSDQHVSGTVTGSLTNFVNQWVNMTFTVNGTAPIRIYINGTEASYSAGSPGNGPSSWSYTAGPCSIGNRNNSLEFFSGSFGSFQIYNRALSASEVSQNYNAQKSRFNL
jgi:hypothetical protein